MNSPYSLCTERLGFRYTHDEVYAPTGLKHPSHLLSAQAFRKLREAGEGAHFE